MNSIFNYDNLIIKDGLTGDYKLEVLISPSDVEFERDLMGLSTTSIKGVVRDTTTLIQKLDIVIWANMLGTVSNIIYDGLIVELELSLGADSVQRKISGLGTVNMFDYFIANNMQPLSVYWLGSFRYIQEDSSDAYVDAIARQIRISNNLAEGFDIKNNAIFLEEYLEPPFKLRIDDPAFKLVSSDVTEDSINELTLVNEDSPIVNAHYYLNSKGEVSTDPSNLDRPPINDILEVAKHEWDDIEVAMDYFKKQEYAKEIVIEVPYPTPLLDDIGVLLGREVELYGTNYYQKIKVTKINIVVGKMTLTLGTSRSRIDDIWKGD